MPEPTSSPGNEQPEGHPVKRQPAFSLAPPLAVAATAPTFDDPGGELPPASGGNRFVCVVRDLRSLFVYWELVLPIRRIPGARLAIAVHRADGTHETTCPLEPSGGTRFLTVAGTDTRYHLTLGYLPKGAIHRNDMVLVLAERDVDTPRDRPITAPGKAQADSEPLLEVTSQTPTEIRALLFPTGAGTASSSSSH